MAGQWSLSRFCMDLTSILSRLRTDVLPNDTQTRSISIRIMMFFCTPCSLVGCLLSLSRDKENSARQFYIIIGLDRERLLVNSSIATKYKQATVTTHHS